MIMSTGTQEYACGFEIMVALSSICKGCLVGVAGFLRYPPRGGGVHPPIPREGVLGDELGDGANLTLRQTHKNTGSRVVRAAGA